MQNNAEKIVARYILNQRIAQVVAALCIPVPVLIYLFQPSLILFVVETIVFVFILYAFRIICAFFNITKLNSILVRQCDLDEYNKQYDLALETAKECFISAIQPLAKITSAYSLAKLHFLKGDYASAITKCKYVIKHGNKLHCVVLARQLLEECEKL